MAFSSIIASDHQARETKSAIDQIDHTLSSEEVLKSIVQGLPQEVISGVRRSLSTERRELFETLQAYHEAKSGNFVRLKTRAGKDPGEKLIVARLMRGWSQKELARKLGLREQAVQRYENEKYQSISLAGLLRVARALEVTISVDNLDASPNVWRPSYELSQVEAQKILKHARAHGWLEEDEQADEAGLAKIKKNIAEHVGEYGTPSLLRTGLNVHEKTGDWDLLAWKAQVTLRARAIILKEKVRYRPLAYTWLKDLVSLSARLNGPALARDFLQKQGIVLIVEPHITGMHVDGAAFLVDGVPVVGVTLLRDSLDNFWFTLLHEVAHVILHYRTGLASGFFDDLEKPNIDEFEEEANKFAGNMLIPEEVWSRSPARIARTAEPIEHLAKTLNISPAIIFGRIRMERKNYTLFSDKIGRGQVRKQLITNIEGVK